MTEATEPHLSANTVRDTLEALRQAAPPDTYMLVQFLIVRQRLQPPEALAGEAAVAHALYALLTEEITARLDALRKLEHLPPTSEVGGARAPLETAFERDFAQGNVELEAWSLLYHRYVCIDLDLQVQEIADRIRLPARTIRRRLSRGLARLTARLIEKERSARAHHARLRMRLALPFAKPPELVGMDAVARRALSALGGVHPVVLHGPGGAGKTALAAWLAHQLIDQNAIDDLVWLQDAALDALPVHVLEALGGAAAPDPVMALRAHAQRYRLLVVLDAAEALICDTSALAEWLDALGAARVVMTSRVAPPAASGAQLIALRELDAPSAWCLMEHEASLRGLSTGTAYRAEQFEKVWEAVGGNPLALRVAVAHLHVFAAGRVAGHLEALDMGGENLFDALYRTAWDALDTEARRLWLAMRVFAPGVPITLEDLEHLVAPAASALLVLARRALVDVDAGDVPRYTLPRLARAFLMREPAHREADAHALGAVLAAGSGLAPEAIFAHGAHLLMQFGMEAAFDLVRAVHRAASKVGQWAAWAPHLRRLRDRCTGDAYAQMTAWLAEAERHLGNLTESFALLRAVADGADESIRAAVLVELAAVHRLAGRLDAARAAAADARQRFGALDDAEGRARATVEYAQIELDAGRPALALRLLNETPAPSERQRARFDALLGNVYVVSGDVGAALRMHRRVLERSRQSAHTLNLGRALMNLGRAQLDADDLDAAEASLERALGIMSQTRDVLGQVRARANLAVLYARRGHHRRAIDLLGDVLEEQEAFGDQRGATTSRENLAEVRMRAANEALKRKQTRAALRHLQAGQALYAKLGHEEQATQTARLVAEVRARLL